MPKTDKLSMAAMKSAAQTYGIKLPTGDPAAAAEELRKHFRANYELDKLAACGNCEYESSEELTSCPYCGTDLGGAEEPKPVVKKRQPKGATGEVKPAKRGRKPKAETEELAPPEPPDPKLVAEIEARVGKIKELRKGLVKNTYAIGTELREINEKQLFKAKGHKSFVAFCKEELEYSRVMAYKYMSLTLFSEEDAMLLGPTKADLIANAGTAENGELSKKQKKLLDMVKKGASRTDLEKELNKGKSRVERDEASITLVGRVREKEVLVPWISEKSGKPTDRNTKGKYAELELVTGIILTLVESAKGDGIVLKFSKVGAPEAEPEASEEDAEAEIEPEDE